MRRQPHPHAGVPGSMVPNRLDDAKDALDVIEEAPLARDRSLPPESAVGVQHGQHRDRQPRRAQRRERPLAQFGRVGVGRPVRLVVDVVELGDAREPALEEFHRQPAGHRRDLVRTEPVEGGVHRLPPRPEGVLSGTRHLGAADERPLEGMGVQVRHPGHDRPGRRTAPSAEAPASTRDSRPPASTSMADAQPSDSSADGAK